MRRHAGRLLTREGICCTSLELVAVDNGIRRLTYENPGTYLCGGYDVLLGAFETLRIETLAIIIVFILVVCTLLDFKPESPRVVFVVPFIHSL